MCSYVAVTSTKTKPKPKQINNNSKNENHPVEFPVILRGDKWFESEFILRVSSASETDTRIDSERTEKAGRDPACPGSAAALGKEGS